MAYEADNRPFASAHQLYLPPIGVQGFGAGVTPAADWSSCKENCRQFKSKLYKSCQNLTDMQKRHVCMQKADKDIADCFKLCDKSYAEQGGKPGAAGSGVVALAAAAGLAALLLMG